MVVASSRSSDSGLGITIGVVVFAVLALVLFLRWYYSPAQQARRALAAVRPAPLASFPDGVVGKVVGAVALTGDALRAPLSGRRCAHFDVHVEEYRSRGKSGSWITVIREVESCGFLLSDDSGVARVDVTGARVVTNMDTTRRSGTFHDATPELEAFLARHGRSSKGWIFNKRIRYREGVLEPGERVAVLGRLGTETDPSPTTAGEGYRGAPTRRVLRAPPAGELLVSDEPGTQD